jgi:hypothetical protein
MAPLSYRCMFNRNVMGNLVGAASSTPMLIKISFTVCITLMVICTVDQF